MEKAKYRADVSCFVSFGDPKLEFARHFFLALKWRRRRSAVPTLRGSTVRSGSEGVFGWRQKPMATLYVPDRAKKRRLAEEAKLTAPSGTGESRVAAVACFHQIAFPGLSRPWGSSKVRMLR